MCVLSIHGHPDQDQASVCTSIVVNNYVTIADSFLIYPYSPINSQPPRHKIVLCACSPVVGPPDPPPCQCESSRILKRMSSYPIVKISRLDKDIHKV